MPTLNLVTELTIDDLLTVVAKLNEAELAEFEAGFDQLLLSRLPASDKEAAQIADAHRLPPGKQARLRSLLEKNREEDITEIEVAELDAYIVELDQALKQTADDLLELAKHRQKAKSKTTPSAESTSHFLCGNP
jgi:hypothetical protein